ncbi:MAG: hypothetical protein JNM17_25480 [Archangium sp.]|nr:hypothetical protein [Archangium sp.]
MNLKRLSLALFFTTTSACFFALPGGPTGGGGGSAGGTGGGGSTGGGTGGGATGGGTVNCGGGGTGSCSGVSLTSNGVLDFDIKRLELHGRLTLNGGMLPTATRTRGFLVFSKDGHDDARLALGTSGDFNYGVTLTPGEYTISYQPADAFTVFSQSRLCATDDVQDMPCNAGILREMSITASGTLDFDLRSVRVTGGVTMNASTVPMASGDRGALSFGLQRGGSARTRAFGPSGAPTYALHLLSGTYDVDYEGRGACAMGWPVPCNSGEIRSGASLTSSGALDIDIPAVALSGRVTQDNAMMPDGSGRGSLEFARVNEPAATTSLPVSGAATYDIVLLKGSYVITWRATPQVCTGTNAPAHPCTSATVRGCP